MEENEITHSQEPADDDVCIEEWHNINICLTPIPTLVDNQDDIHPSLRDEVEISRLSKNYPTLSEYTSPVNEAGVGRFSPNERNAEIIYLISCLVFLKFLNA